jgi:protein-S-isoprenylcysteine O-methyltransferase Ste14
MPDSPQISPSKLVFTGLYLLAWPLLVLWLAGDWRWPEGWAFGLWFIAMCGTSIIWLYRHDPALLAERYRRPGTGGQGRADQRIVQAIVIGFVAWIVVMPLDARRFHWTPPLPVGLQPIGAVLLLLSGWLLFRSFTDNPFLSPLVRIQSERQHRVVTTGVYRLVRHPMYLGAACMFIGAPMLLRSTLGFVVGAALSLLLAGRILIEERLLAQELEGYDDYRRAVRYRLIPFVW